MFQNLRIGSTIYILNKNNNPTLEKGTIINVSVPTPKYPMPTTFGQPQEMTVDIIVNVNNQEVNYQKLPASADIADFGNTGIVLSSNREAINSEILNLKNKSIDIINSFDYHKNLVVHYDKLLSDLNPDFAERQKQQEEIKMLKEQLNTISNNVSNLLEA